MARHKDLDLLRGIRTSQQHQPTHQTTSDHIPHTQPDRQTVVFALLVSADPRSRRRRTLHPDQRALPIADLADANAIHGHTFVLTNRDMSTSGKAAAVEYWYRNRTSIENIFLLSGSLPCGMTSFELGD